jgi:hypothetical protein
VADPSWLRPKPGKSICDAKETVPFILVLANKLILEELPLDTKRSGLPSPLKSDKETL